MVSLEAYLAKLLGDMGEAKEDCERFVMRLRVDNVTLRSVFNYMSILHRWLVYCRLKGQGYKDWSAESAYNFISKLDNPHSRVQYAVAIKRFFQVTDHPDAKKFTIPHRPKAKLPPILTEDEVLQLARACDNVRDKALILVTYESTRRNHEVRGVRIGDVKFDEYGALVTFHSTKSEDATIRLVMSASVLQQVIENHRDRGNPDAYVFYAVLDQITESRFRQIMREAAHRAGLKRRVYPHLLRHSRIAQLKRENRLTDADIMNISGHSSRRMLDVYGRITMTMTNDKLLEIQGLRQVEAEKKSVVTVCPRCSFANGPLAMYCSRCTYPLTPDALGEVRKRDEDLKLLKNKVDAFDQLNELLEDKDLMRKFRGLFAKKEEA